MPIYEYKCLECDSHFEKIQKSSDEPLKVCEKCNGKVEKQISLSGFQFKGEGWYVTDYAKDKNSKSEKTTTNKTDNGKNSDSKSTETKETASKDIGNKSKDIKKDRAKKKE